ncbi:MAG TPA: hypothetical protein VFF73_36160 [Planctomycetota bacterium]|nr:hypothetical protein [Planctomycetota bacterium]
MASGARQTAASLIFLLAWVLVVSPSARAEDALSGYEGRAYVLLGMVFVALQALLIDLGLTLLERVSGSGS